MFTQAAPMLAQTCHTALGTGVLRQVTMVVDPCRLRRRAAGALVLALPLTSGVTCLVSQFPHL